MNLAEARTKLDELFEAVREQQHAELAGVRLSMELLSADARALVERHSGRDMSPNVFSVWALDGKEDTISRLVTWLADPAGDHGLGTTFLREFVLTLAHRVAADDRQLLMKLLDTPDLWTTCVRREVSRGHSRADVIVDHRVLRIVIETKLGHVEGDEQTRRYAETFRRRPDTVFIYLAPSGAKPSSSIAFSDVPHDALFQAVERTLRTQRGAPRTRDALLQFLEAFVEEEH